MEHVSENRPSSKRRKSFYNSKDSIGFVFHVLEKDSEVSKEASKEAPSMEVPEFDVSSDISTTEVSQLDETSICDEASISIDPSLLKEKLKELEIEIFTKKIIKRWCSLKPDASDGKVEQMRKRVSEYLKSSNVLWQYYFDELTEQPNTAVKYLEERISVMKSEREEWDRVAQFVSTECKTRESELASKCAVSDPLSTTAHSSSLSSSSSADPIARSMEQVHHAKEVALALDGEYSRLFGELSELCDQFEEQLSRKEAGIKVRYDELATPYTLLSKASHITAKLQALED